MMVKSRTDAKVFYHCCGAIRDFIPDFIEIGVDILNPVQVSAAGMDTADLKKRFGNDISFWGGGCDTQRILPFGTPDEIREEVRRRIGVLAEGGGFVFSTVHNIQNEVPPENIIAMFEAFNEFRKY
jgi:uroporphyrinogen decarboxylase